MDRALWLTRLIFLLGFGLLSGRAAPPANDNFDSPVNLTGLNINLSAELAGSSQEEGELKEKAGGGSLWYYWVPAESAGVSVELTQTGEGESDLTIYEGQFLSSLTRKLSLWHPFLTRSSFNAEAGKIYRIRLAGTVPQVGLRIAAGPLNNLYENRKMLSGSRVREPGTTIGATAEPSEPGTEGALTPTVWYEWEVPSSGGYEISVGDLNSVQVVNRYHAYSPGQWPDLAPHPAFNPLSPYQNAVRLQAGERILFQVFGRNQNGAAFALNISPAALNDEFARRLPLIPELPVRVNTLGGTREQGEPRHEGRSEGRSFWWEFIPEQSGGYFLLSSIAWGPPTILVYQGNELENLTLAPGLVASSGTASFWGSRGQRYLVLLDTTQLMEGSLHLDKTAPFDNFSQAQNITELSWAGGKLFGATVEPGETNSLPGVRATAWFKWTAPFTGGAVARLNVATTPSRIIVAEGSSVHDLRVLGMGEVVAGGPHSVVPFRVEAGKTYHIALDAKEGVVTYSLNIDPTPAYDEAETAPQILTGVTNQLDSFKATWVPGEPTIMNGREAPVGWWRWTAPASGPYELRVKSSAPTYGVALFEAQPTKLRISRLLVENQPLYFSFQAFEGTEYLLAIAHAAPYPASFEFGLHAGVRHDNIATPVFLSGMNVIHSTVYRAAVWNLLEPLPEWSSKNTFWYEWTAPAAGQYVLSAFQPNAAPELAILIKGENGALDLYDLTAAPAPPIVRSVLHTESGKSYLIGVAAPLMDSAATLTVRIDPSPSNDSMWTPQRLSGSFLPVHGSTWGATRDLFEPSDFDSVWYQWQADMSGSMHLSTTGPGVTVFTDTGIPLTQVGSGWSGNYWFGARAGSNYLIRVASTGMPQDFSFLLAPQPPNKHPDGAIELTGLEVQSTSWTAGQQLSIHDRPALYWKWKAPADSVVTLSARVAESSAGAQINVALPSSVTRWTNVMGLPETFFLRPETNQVTFVATSNVLYTITVRTVPSSIPLGYLGSTNVTLTLGAEPFARPVMLASNASAEWLLGGERPWLVSTNVTYQGAPMLESRLQAGIRQNWIEGTFYGTGYLEFAWAGGAGGTLNVRSALGFVDGLTMAAGTEWRAVRMRLTYLKTVLRWAHTHDPRRPLDVGWVGNIKFIPDEPLPLQFNLSSIRFDGSGRFWGSFQAQPRTTYVLESSTNFVDWRTVLILRDPVVPWVGFQSGNVLESPQQFFRVLKQ